MREPLSENTTRNWRRDRERLRIRDSSTLLVSFAFVIGLMLSACSVPLYKVAGIPNKTPSASGNTITATTLEITATALIDDDQAFERFETNLPLGGILAVDVLLRNRRNEASRPLSFEIADATGKKFSSMDGQKMLKRVMKFEGVRVYAREGKQSTEAQLQSLTVPKKIVLNAQEEKRGVLFFYVKQDVANMKGLVLTVKGAEQPIRIPLQ